MNSIIEQKQLKEKAAAALESMIRDTHGKPLLLLLSGGSSMNLLNLLSEDVLTGNVTVGMLDDRYSLDERVNSYDILKSTAFYLNGLNTGAVFLDSSVNEPETLETYAERYESEIKKWMRFYPDGVIRATIGIGPDGHTSGILPEPENPEEFNKRFNGDALIVGYDVGDKNPHRYRMTSTFTLMRKCDQTITFMEGQNKKQALEKVMAEEGSLAETPGRIVRELKNHSLFTDIML